MYSRHAILSRPERSPRGALHSFPQPRPQGAFSWLFFPNPRLLALSHILFTLGEKSDGFCCWGVEYEVWFTWLIKRLGRLERSHARKETQTARSHVLAWLFSSNRVPPRETSWVNLRRTIVVQAKIMEKILQTKMEKIILAGVFSFSVNKVKNMWSYVEIQFWREAQMKLLT